LEKKNLINTTRKLGRKDWQDIDDNMIINLKQHCLIFYYDHSRFNKVESICWCLWKCKDTVWTRKRRLVCWCWHLWHQFCVYYVLFVRYLFCEFVLYEYDVCPTCTLQYNFHV
jgi:hypothetical protein